MFLAVVREADYLRPPRPPPALREAPPPPPPLKPPLLPPLELPRTTPPKPPVPLRELELELELDELRVTVELLERELEDGVVVVVVLRIVELPRDPMGAFWPERTERELFPALLRLLTVLRLELRKLV